MPKFKVSIEIEGQKFKKTFDWYGTEAELAQAVRDSIIINVVK